MKIFFAFLLPILSVMASRPVPEVGLALVEGTDRIFGKSAVLGGEKRVNRLYVDIPFKYDMRTENAISFDFRSSDMAKFSRASIYFRSGKGWYHGSFVPLDGDGWQRITVNKRDVTMIEGKPSGWGKVDCVRIACWCVAGASGAAKIEVANFAGVARNSKILMVVGEAAHGKSGLTYASTLSGSMDAAGIGHAVVADYELAAGDLEGRKVVVLPYNGPLPDGKDRLIGDFVAAGGKVVACYTVSSAVISAMGLKIAGWHSSSAGTGRAPFSGFLRRGEGLKGQPAFVAQTSRFGVIAEPDGEGEIVATWTTGERVDTGKAAIVRTGKGVFFSHVWMGGATPEKIALVQSVFACLMPELQVGFDRRREEAAAQRAKSMAKLARHIRPRKGERSALWCHGAYGPASTWDEAVAVMAKAGCTDLIANLCWGGHAHYSSSVLPVHRSVKGRGDAYELADKACRKHGVKLHVWRVCGYLAGAGKEYRGKLAAEKRLAVGFGGECRDDWVCLSHPANIEVEIASMEELAEKGAQGVHLDYIRYRDGDTCFCGGCRERFERFAGVKVADWPKDLRSNNGLKTRWTAFRCGNIDKIVKGVHERVKAKNPKCEISAAVFGDWVASPESVAQSSEKWCAEGLLDFVCPMDYSESTSFFRNAVRGQLPRAGKVPMLPGIGLSCWRSFVDGAGLLADQIKAAREAGAAGWTIFDYGPVCFEILKELGK